MAELRSFIFIDQLQPQTLCYLSSWIRGSLPRANMAAQIIEVAPGLDIEALTNIAVKQTDVKAGVLVVERQFGYLEFHSRDTSSVKASADAILDELGATASDATQPKILGSKVITNVDHQHAFLINRNKLGSMIVAGEALYTLEMQPASYAILAANAAEKAGQHQDRRFPHDRRQWPGLSRRQRGRDSKCPRSRRNGAFGSSGGDGNAMTDNALASLIREVLAEELVRLRDDMVQQAPKEETVRIASDRDLQGFVQKLLALTTDPDTRRAVEDGRIMFRLAGAARSPASCAVAPSVPGAMPATTSGDIVVIDHGFVSERQIDRMSRDVKRVVLGRTVKLTPLARDRLRQRGVMIERKDQ